VSAKDDTRTNEELLHVALTEEDEDRAWDAIAVLYLRASPDTLEAARQLCASADSHARRVGADILGQLGISEREKLFQEEAVATLLDMLEGEQDPQALHSIAVALGHRHDPRAIRPLARLKNHPDFRVREGVVHGIMAYEDDLAIATLIELSDDPESLVRDWAAFSLGAQIKTDTPDIRAALLARTTDEDVDIRAEAILGLAKRYDERAVEILIPLLRSDIFWDDTTESDYFRTLELEAAEELADPHLLPALEQLRQDWWQYNEAMEHEDSLYDVLKTVIEVIKAGQPNQEG